MSAQIFAVFLSLAGISISISAAAETQKRESRQHREIYVRELKSFEPPSWESFAEQMAESRSRERVLGTSYIGSGLMVSIGGVIGQQETADSAGRFVFGLSQGLGAFAFGYGLQILMTGNEMDSFYIALNSASVSNEEKSRILAVYLNEERERLRILGNIQMSTHFLVAGLNFYSASLEADSNSKGVLNGLGLVNLLIGTTYFF